MKIGQDIVFFFLISRTAFRFPRYFSTVLSLFHYILETRFPKYSGNSDSRGCGRFISLRTVAEKSLMPLKAALLIDENTGI